MQDEEESLDGYARYEEIINEVLAGRTEGHKCPFCRDGDLECRIDGEGFVTRRCPKCGRFFEGMLA